jgi:hypothetical protein
MPDIIRQSDGGVPGLGGDMAVSEFLRRAGHRSGRAAELCPVYGSPPTSGSMRPKASLMIL